MSIKVRPHHPLAEIIAKRLFGIELVPAEEKLRMIDSAINKAVDYHEEQLILADELAKAIIEYIDGDGDGRPNVLLALSAFKNRVSDTTKGSRGE